MKTIFWNVDTQNDFMNPNGALYVPGAESIKKNLELLTRYAFREGIRTVYSADAHLPSNKELQRNGGPFPDHCMQGTAGAEIIPETKPVNPIVIENHYYAFSYLEQFLRGKRDILIQKEENDVFANPATDFVLKILRPKKIIVYGVATDYCVKDAVSGLVKYAEVCLVSDAIKAVSPEKEKDVLEKICNSGARLITTNDVLEGKL